ncbi:MAG: hypothetical protein ABI811_18340 [Acidobacteriota bacterium]
MAASSYPQSWFPFRLRRVAASGIISLVLLLGVWTALRSPGTGQPPKQVFQGQISPVQPFRALSSAAQAFTDRGGVAIYHEFYGPRGYQDPQAALSLQLGWADGLTVSPPVEAGMTQIVNRYAAGLMLRLAGSPAVAASTKEEIDRQRVAFETIASAAPANEFLWSLMPEWDQSGGPWVAGGRPRYSGLPKAAAYTAFLNYYQSRHPELMHYLQQPATNNVLLTAITDSSPNVFYAYELGADLTMLERGIDELGDLSTGIAFLRGAATQYGRLWGVDMSTWRTSTNMATRYDPSGTLLGGWSSGYIRRHYYAAYLAGAHLIQNEAATYRYADGRANPLGTAAQEFADFALRRHPDVGTPVVTTALLVDHFNGFDPKHGIFNQGNSVWYQDIPYSDGDFMIDNLLRLAYPNHWLHGLAPNAPFSNSSGVPNTSKFQAFLAAGGDPRPYEPMPTTRWGDSLNVITNGASRASLNQYKVIILTGDVTLDARLRADLRSWVEQGGTLLLNAAQTNPEDETFLGATVQRFSPRSGSTSTWLDNGTVQSEPAYRYSRIQPLTAEILAVNEFKDPLITRNSLGNGQVLLMAPEYLQSTGHQFLQLTVQLLDSLVSRYALARISGPPVEYLINQAPNRLIVTLINNSGTAWPGEITVSRLGVSAVVSEYITEQSAFFSVSRSELIVPANIPAYDVRVFAIDYADSAQSNPRPAPVTDPSSPVNRRTRIQ